MEKHYKGARDRLTGSPFCLLETTHRIEMYINGDNNENIE